MTDGYWEPSRPFSSPDFQFSEALPGRLWIGEAPRRQDVDTLRRLGVTDIVNLTRLEEIHLLEREAQFNVHAFPFPDGHFRFHEGPSALRDRAHQMMIGAASRLDELMSRQAPTYLHCVAGISRSPTVFILWLIRSGQAASYREALQKAFRVRPIVSPNPDLVDLVRDMHPQAFLG